jgi:type IX secretion system PorP/SprF family membrane protein
MSLYNYHFLTGYKFELSENFKFRPAAIVRYAINSPFQYELNASFLFAKERFLIGPSWRSSKEIILIAQFKANEQIKVGIGYDWSFDELSKYSNGTFEFSISYEFRYLVKSAYPLDF